MTRPLETSRTHTLALGSDHLLRRRFMVIDEPLQGNLRFGLLLGLPAQPVARAAAGLSRPL